MISVITPVYNRAVLLEETGRSILAQTYNDLEWIIVDDGSEEDIEAVAKKLNDKRIRYHRIPRSGKLSMVHNIGISMAKGEYIIMPDSDDLWKNDALEKMHAILDANREVGFVIAEAEIVKGDTILYPFIYTEEQKSKEGDRFYKELFTNKLFVIFISGALLRRSCLDRSGLFDEQIKFGDKDFFTRLAYHFKAIITKEVLVTIRRHDQNVSILRGRGSPAEESFKEELYTLQYFFEKKFIDAEFYNRMSAVYTVKLGDYYYAGGFYKDARLAYRKALKTDAMNARVFAKYCLSFLKKSK